MIQDLKWIFKEVVNVHHLEEILVELLLLDKNETTFIEDKETYMKFIRLTIEVTKASKNIRYCSKDRCVCHPEYKIKNLLKDKKLLEFLNEYSKGTAKSLNKHCKKYVPYMAEALCED